MRIELTRVAPEQLLSRRPGEGSAVVAVRIAAGRSFAAARNGGVPNALLSGVAAQRACSLPRRARDALTQLARATGMTGRGVHRVLRVARTIADLEARQVVTEDDIRAAVALREPGADTVNSAAAA